MPVCAWRSIATLPVPQAQGRPQARRVARWVPVVAETAFGLQIAQILWVGDLDACRSRSLGAGRGGGVNVVHPGARARSYACAMGDKGAPSSSTYSSISAAPYNRRISCMRPTGVRASKIEVRPVTARNRAQPAAQTSPAMLHAITPKANARPRGGKLGITRTI